MLSYTNSTRTGILDVEFVEEEIGCRGADLDDGIDLLANQDKYQPRTQVSLLLSGSAPTWHNSRG